ncbi:hypothetical protein [Streptomyces sp. JS01]|uniref:hypothetical protein n=1 Tax=Streptomyces sp. JS01 TaxID=1525753 RepID=UPI0012FEEEBD|nr:hypothetical protein [Streptomyces sp. JS01]
MDSGAIAIIGAAAGVLGAAVGASGAIIAASVTGRSQERTQHAHWRRQVRRDAYSALINAASDLYDELGPRSHSLEESSVPYPTRVPRELAASLDKACHTVQLEGPAEVAAQAEIIRDLFLRWAGAIHWREANGEFQLRHPALEALSGLDLLATKQQADAAQGKFLLLARTALD